MNEIPPSVRCKDPSNNTITCKVAFGGNIGTRQSWTCVSKAKWGEGYWERGRANNRLGHVPMETLGNPIYVIQNKITKDTICEALGKDITENKERWIGSKKQFFPFWRERKKHDY